MPYGDTMPYLPAMSRLMGEVEQPTQAQGLNSPQFGGSPEQLMGMLQDPHIQNQLQQWGIHFDPSQMRQSPFLPNQFMQHHPLLGGMLNQGMANVAATPEAPAVSGAGSGMTRAMQGMMGGPEMLRQYQVRQMLAPFQAAGMQMPMQEFQRKQELLNLLTKMEQDRQNLAESGQDLRQQELERKDRAATQRIEATRPFADPAGHVWNYMSPQAPVPQGGDQGLDFTAQGQAQPSVSAFSGLPMPGPGGYGQAPAQAGIPGGWQQAQQQPTPEQIQAYTQATHPERAAGAGLSGARTGELEDERKLGMPGAKVGTEKAKGDYYSGRADEARAKGQQALAKMRGETPENFAKFSKQFNDERDKWIARDQHIRELEAGGMSPEAAENMRSANDSSFEQAKKTIDDARKVGSGSGASQLWQRPGPVSPGAKTDLPRSTTGQGGQAGGAGAQRSEGTAVASPSAPANPFRQQQPQQPQ